MTIAQAPTQPTRKAHKMPSEIRAVFTSTMIARTKRLSLLVKWFMENYSSWESDDQHTHAVSLSITDFAERLTQALEPYHIVINRQRVWTWLKERNLPRQDNFNVMVKTAAGWQLDFALLVLSILDSDEPDLAKRLDPP